jgi:N-acylneuraminate cytidylyltransferase
METLAFIPVRGGSKSIPHKNIKHLAGRPLVHWTMLAALGCPKIDKLYVASEDPTIRKVAGQIRDSRLEVINRDPATATDEATTESALMEFAENHSFDRVILIQATSPLLTSADLSGAIDKLDQSKADSLLSVTRQHCFIWKEKSDGSVSPSNYNPQKRPRRQDWSGELFENGAFYISTRKALLESGCRISGRVDAWEMPSETAVELDEPYDWAVAEQQLQHKKGAALAERCRPIELLVTDVDGVLTDAGMYYGPDGEVSKKFNTRDGMGLGRWQQAGFKAAIMTSENTPIVKSRAAKLKIDLLFLGVKDKGKELDSLIKKEGLSLDQVAFIGDDINDLPALEKVGLSACPSDALEVVKKQVHYVCRQKGGGGCVREFIDLLMLYQ